MIFGLDSPGANTYLLDFLPSSPYPSLTVMQEGLYKLEVVASNSCGTVYQTFNIYDNGNRVGMEQIIIFTLDLKQKNIIFTPDLKQNNIIFTPDLKQNF